MIAIRKLMFGSWGLEAGMQIRVIRPTNAVAEPTGTKSVVERAAGEAAMFKQAEANRAMAERIRWTHSA